MVSFFSKSVAETYICYYLIGYILVKFLNSYRRIVSAFNDVNSVVVVISGI